MYVYIHTQCVHIELQQNQLNHTQLLGVSPGTDQVSHEKWHGQGRHKVPWALLGVGSGSCWMVRFHGNFRFHGVFFWILWGRLHEIFIFYSEEHSIWVTYNDRTLFSRALELCFFREIIPFDGPTIQVSELL